MRHATRFLIALILALVIPAGASATDFEDMDICLGRQLLARMLCKDPIEVSYVAQIRQDLYLFSVFYANREARFFVGVGGKYIRVQGKEFQKMTRTIPYHFDATAKCAVVDYSSPDCPTNERIVCCSQKTVEEQLDDKFWNRPIPELLEEDLRRALEDTDTTKQEDKEKANQQRPPSQNPGQTPDQQAQ